MIQQNIEQFKVAYEKFRHTQVFQERVKQSEIVPLFRDIIRETLLNEPLTNAHLTGLIQLLKHNCQPDNFIKYLNINVQDPVKREDFLGRFTGSGITGYTGAGLNSIKKLSEGDLKSIKGFLVDAFEIDDVEDAIELCSQFDRLNIPQVRAGIYSPWLHYINPHIFPISNNSNIDFRNWIDMAPDYPSCIRDFNYLAGFTGEKDLGLIDWFAHLGTHREQLKEVNVAGRRLFKISMSPAADEVDQMTFNYCLEKQVIIMGGTTAAIGTSRISQNELFRQIMQVGDYFYLCRGNKGIILMGRITGDWTDFFMEGFQYTNWIKRPYEIVATSINQSQQYTGQKKHWTPNFNSTFTLIPDIEIEMANQLIFAPFFNTIFTKPMNPEPESSPGTLPAPLNLILYGPPGTGKTYHTVNGALQIINPGFDLNQDRHLVKQEFERLVDEGQVVFTTFHQSMSYEDFVEGIKPQTNAEQDLIYEVDPGIFKRLATAARDNWMSAREEHRKQLSFDEAFSKLLEEWEENPNIKFPLKRAGNEFTILGFSKSSIRFRKSSGGINHTLSIATLGEFYYDRKEIKPSGLGIYYQGILHKLNSYQSQSAENREEKQYVLIIDEINRGNVSQIFGELITLIEPDKRSGQEEALKVVLPYSKESFSVPPNLHIIGTMNTADRSVEALDTALRRRFTFREMMPDLWAPGMNQVIDGISLKVLLQTLNRRIELLLDRDHQIGHSFLMKVKEINGLMQVFFNQIIPLLKEYFYGDFGKIGLVLDDGFVIAEKGNGVFGSFWYEDKSLLEEKMRYQIIDYRSSTPPDTGGFRRALEKLISNPVSEEHEK
jgi:hypothetical protein